MPFADNHPLRSKIRQTIRRPFLLLALTLLVAVFAVSENAWADVVLLKRGGRVEGVRNLMRDFDDAVMPEGNYERIKAACEKARARYDDEVHQARMDARPLWRKALGLQPK